MSLFYYFEREGGEWFERGVLRQRTSFSVDLIFIRGRGQREDDASHPCVCFSRRRGDPKAAPLLIENRKNNDNRPRPESPTPGRPPRLLLSRAT